MRNIWGILLILTSSVCLAQSPIVSTTDGMTRIGPNDPAPAGKTISLSGGRGETVDAQIIVTAPASGLTNISLSASVLSGGTATIPASAFTLYREFYITVTGTANYGGGSNPPRGSGTYPEPLIPFVDPETGSLLNGSLKAVTGLSSGNQPYWIDLTIPVVPAGSYSGSISVTADQGSVSIPLSLTVWNFQLPSTPTELSEWTLWNPASGNTVATLANALMRNKVMSRYVNSSDAANEITSFGLNRSGLDGLVYVESSSCGSYPSVPTTASLNSFSSTFPKLPLDLYVADELNGCTGAYTFLNSIAASAHAANPLIKTIATFNAIDSNLNGSIDHWVLLASQQEWPSAYTGKGDLWSYTSCNTGKGNTPEWLIDYDPINERIQAGFLNANQNATGILYYRADGWTAGNAVGSWTNVNESSCSTGSGPGDGIFIYPPGPVGSTESVPGIRLKNIRDGIEDYEYVQLLKNAGQAQFAITTMNTVATSWTNWTKSSTALLSARQTMGNMLDSLNRPAAPTNLTVTEK